MVCQVSQKRGKELEKQFVTSRCQPAKNITRHDGKKEARRIGLKTARIGSEMKHFTGMSMSMI